MRAIEELSVKLDAALTQGRDLVNKNHVIVEKLNALQAAAAGATAEEIADLNTKAEELNAILKGIVDEDATTDAPTS
jgi:hypothetical protein